MRNGKTPYAHDCAEWEVETDLITDKFDKFPIKKRENKFNRQWNYKGQKARCEQLNCSLSNGQNTSIDAKLRCKLE